MKRIYTDKDCAVQIEGHEGSLHLTLGPQDHESVTIALTPTQARLTADALARIADISDAQKVSQ